MIYYLRSTFHTNTFVLLPNNRCNDYLHFCGVLKLFQLFLGENEGRRGGFYLTMHSTHFIYAYGVDPLSYFSFQPVLHDWCNKGRGMCYPVCRMVHIKEPLLSIEKSSPCGGSGFPLSLSEWSFTICLTPYNRK